MKRWLVFGLSGQVGAALREQLMPGEADILAISRQPQEDLPGLRWRRAGYWDAFDYQGQFDAVVSLGPLDVFARWLEADSGLAPPRLVALGSTSVHSKLASPDPSERGLALRLADAEARLADYCREHGCALSLLRPTLIYGGGERSLSRIVALARRWRYVPLPTDATGLRQPVHAGDLAAAVLGCLRAERPVPGSYDLPGGETLSYGEMIRRTLAVTVPDARLVRLPGFLFRSGMRALAAVGAADVGEGHLARLDRDLVYDDTPARRDLGYSPRPFRPEAAMFKG
ncbi:NAD-dependent epimerase/dehydratase family protein [Arenimonas terrae]|uniref:Nucleoside-diphosphate sugar epimerase n=1 Tax=Arenimonas terrae TaxID=2546226 RepID=A0A5C4RXF2_9GAMM|nr:hypothetical protein [Arenimonas terrae]TNJ35609.1 hypothetical protein E1B00_07640 [Arenimonas terrae]